MKGHRMEDLRLSALDAAIAEGVKGADLIARAEEIYQWLRYGADAATPVRRAMAGQRVLAEIVSAQGNERMKPVPRADVVGRDGEFKPEFRDYLREKE
jgi:hypothetical protein